MEKEIHFWAKTTPDGTPGISVYEHMINVGCVAMQLAEFSPQILHKFGLEISTIGLLAALHDVGKISPGFQRKCKSWLKENGLIDIDRRWQWQKTMEKDHGKVSHKTIQDELVKRNEDVDTTAYLSAVLGAHHGRMKYMPNPRGISSHFIDAINETNSGIDWNNERAKTIGKIYEYFGIENINLEVNEESPFLWWVAGLTTIADWIGSDERYFEASINNTKKGSQTVAIKAIQSIGFDTPNFNQNLSFKLIFGNKFEPNDMQTQALEVITEPGVYIIEAPMGMGKTEAALGAAYQLLANGKANGIYFALPTQVTSNRIHLRVNEFLRSITSNMESKLIHGNSWLMDQSKDMVNFSKSDNESNEDEKNAREWFTSPKKALLAPFGVGTVDQALLGVVAAKHFFLRRYALAGKVVIIDEVHSYDLYTGTLIDKLIEVLESLGCTVIVLSATLTKKRRNQILGIPSDEVSSDENAYPLITGKKSGQIIKPVKSNVPEPEEINVEFKEINEAEKEALTVSRNGGAVLWICDTVDSAQKQYKRFIENGNQDIKIGLLHSRFPYWRREELENEWMERLGKEGKTRCGCILVSTQIVEQSVDIDADLMISELAPTDMLLQRLGRLWRHDRKNRPLDEPKFIVINEEKSVHDFGKMSAKEINKTLGSKAFVYNAYVLLRSMEVWNKNKKINIPLQMRELIESTYLERNDEPESWQKLYDENCGKVAAYRQRALMSSNIWQAALNDTEGIQTRLNEILTMTLILYKNLSAGELILLDNSKHRIKKKSYQLTAAQAVHKNTIKIPSHYFENPTRDNLLDEYIYEEYKMALVQENGDLDVSGLKEGVKLNYSDDIGVEIIK